jgi:hypothetical protein
MHTQGWLLDRMDSVSVAWGCMIVTLDHDQCDIGPNGGTESRRDKRGGRPLQLATASTVLASLIVLIITGACVYVRAIGRGYGYVSDDLSAHTTQGE